MDQSEVLFDGKERERMRTGGLYPEAEMVFSSVVVVVLIITSACPPLSLIEKEENVLSGQSQ